MSTYIIRFSKTRIKKTIKDCREREVSYAIQAEKYKAQENKTLANHFERLTKLYKKEAEKYEKILERKLKGVGKNGG